MRLIDADAVLDAMRDKLDMQELYLPIHFKELVIDDMPTVDAEPVVRCKDCKHSWIDDEYEELRCMNGFVNEDSFCSSGEKRKGRVKKREIVLCRECKFFVIKPFTTPHYICTFWCDGCETKPEAFCSYGRRKDD